MNYQAAYCVLFRAITKAIDEIEMSKRIPSKAANALTILKSAQIITEEMYISDEPAGERQPVFAEGPEQT